jgi:hypothetical protein
VNFAHLRGVNGNPELRFNECVMPVTESGCHLFLGQLTANGYGRFMVNGKRQTTHRYAWALANGPIPFGMNVCHKCDTPSCVNPNHLFLGTTRDNARDKVVKNRHYHGRRAAIDRSSINDEQAMEIFNSTEMHKNLIAKYGVSKMLIHRIKTKKSWAWIHKGTQA